MTAAVTKHSPLSCNTFQAYARLSGAVGLVIRNALIDRGLRLEVLQRAYDDAERLAAGHALCLHNKHYCPATGGE